MPDDKSRYREQVLSIIEIQDRVVTDSTLMDIATKEAFFNLSRASNEQLKGKLTLVQLKSVASEILTFWRESIGVEVERFWTEMKAGNIEFERKDELQFAISKGRFRRVDIGMAARRDWFLMKDLESVKLRFSERELALIDKLIEKDENVRLGILKKCLDNKKIPQSAYLKFGECMAYFAHSGLFDRYFSHDQVEELNRIWRHFRG